MQGSNLEIQADFDRIALLPESAWEVNQHYHPFILGQLPARCSAALDIGCGTGAFSRLLAERSERVVALDLSPQMIRIAQERSKHHPNIEFLVADALTWPMPAGEFDCVTSIATLHHLPLGEMLTRMATGLKAGGALVVLDLYHPARLGDALSSLMAVPVSAALSLLKTGRMRSSPEVREAWAEHGKRDSYLSLAQIRQTATPVLPGARVRRHLLWRYSLVWTKPPDSS